MDRRLFQAAVQGNVYELHQLLIEDPLILHGVALTSQDNPLHVAATAGHLNFVQEIIRLKPEFAGELNQVGFRPIHIASANGYLEIVKEFLKVSSDHCRITSRDRKTALHYACMKGRIDVVKELVLNCAECVEDVTARGETAVHLAIKNIQFEAVRVMVETLKQINKEGVLKKVDIQGNTALHLATSTKQLEVVELLLGKDTTTSTVHGIEVNAMNESGLTALDLLLLFPSEAGDMEIEAILRRAGAMRTREINSQLATPAIQTGTLENNRSESNQSPLDQLVDYFKFKRGRDSPSEARSTVLVISVLIATATFQAGLTPPGGFWEDSKKSGDTNSTVTSITDHIEGKSILSSRDEMSFGLFLFFNSAGFYVSIFMINILTCGFPLRLELQICIVGMVVTYNIAMATSIASSSRLTVVFPAIAFVLPLCTPLLAKWYRLFSARRRRGSVTDRITISSA